jgi:hypothetical protein
MNIVPDASKDGVQVSQGSRLVYSSTRSVTNAAVAQTVLPGGNVNWSASWNGRPNQHGVKNLAPGTYTIQVTEGGYTASAVFRIGR